MDPYFSPQRQSQLGGKSPVHSPGKYPGRQGASPSPNAKFGSFTDGLPQQLSDVEYSLTLRLHYPTEFGEHLAITGNMPELGEWTKPVELKWCEGNFWETAQPVRTRRPHFNYKYVLMQDGQKVKLEEGLDRIADLGILPEVAHPDNGGLAQVAGINRATSGFPVKHVELNDTWECFKLALSTFYPAANSDDQMMVQGDQDLFQAGARGSAVTMRRAVKTRPWFKEKYGTGVKPYEAVMTLPNPRRVNLNDPIIVEYTYCFCPAGKKAQVTERRLQRSLEVADPRLYTGELGATGSAAWKEQDLVFIVNGIIEKVDGNFAGEFMCSPIEKTGVFIGPAPLTPKDLNVLKQNKIGAVICLCTEEGMRAQGFEWNRMVAQYKQSGINTAINVPVNEKAPKEQYRAKLFEVSQRINDLVSKKMNVFVHDSTGISRAPTAALTYLCLYKNVSCWPSVPQSARIVKNAHKPAVPNVRAVQRVINDNLDFQERVKDKETEEALKHRMNADAEAERRRMDDAKRRQAEEDARRKADMLRQKQEEEARRSLDALRRQKEEEARRKAEQLRAEEKRQAVVSKQYEMLKKQQDELIEKEKHAEMKKVADIQKAKGTEEVKAGSLKERVQDEKHALAQAQAEDAKVAQELKNQQQEERKKLDVVKRDNQRALDELKHRLRAQVDEERKRLLLIQAEVEKLKHKKLAEGVEKGRKEEEERLRKQRIAWEEAERKRLLKMKEDDAERARRAKQTQQKIEDEHYVDEFSDFQVTETELEEQCDELFSETPIIFKPRKGEKLDERIAAIIYQQHITIPVVHIRDKLYLIGPNRQNCELRAGQAMIKVGGGHQRFDEYVPKNHRQFQKKLVTYMINNNESLEWVVLQLMDGKQLKTSKFPLLSEASSPLNNSPRLRSAVARGSTSPRRSFQGQSPQTRSSGIRQSKNPNPISPYKKSGKQY